MKVSRHTLFVLFLFLLSVAIKLKALFLVPFIGVVFIVYTSKYGIKEILITAVFVSLFVYFLSLFSSPFVPKVKWIFESGERKVALLTDGRYLPVFDSVSVGDVVSEKDGSVVEKGGLSSFFERARFALSQRAETSLDYPVSSLVEAVTLGVRYNLPESIKAYMALTGIYPLLAISGLHVAVVFGFIAVWLKLFRMFSLKRAIFIFTLLMPFTGFPVSAVRAYLFILFAVFLKIHGRRVDYVYITVLTAFLMTLFFSISAGFILSFLGALGIFAAMQSDGFKKKIFLVLFPFLFTLPYVVFRFKTVNLLSPISVFVITPLFTLFLLLCFLSEVTLFKIKFLTALTEKAGEILIVFVKWLFKVLHPGVIHVSVPFTIIFIVSFIVFVILIFELDVKYVFFVFSAFLVFLLFNQFYLYGVTEKISGKDLNSSYFLSGEGQKFRNSTLVADYIFPYTETILGLNGVTFKQSVK
ncbi:ComEC/Rec2 family competence protein [Desulfurobacterium sp.]|uniref:ComEC/Rec2 family competence protein n=1 Tax=Desulfurobacterium sp. TaxID=2004706 RepID=UPI002634E1D2|nr:ComEC/Rec2 family competence protein [Desulfurobacterium sp.]